LVNTYGITSESTKEARAKNIQIDIARAIESAKENPHKRRRLNDSNKGNLLLNGDVVKVLYVKFIFACNLPLRLVECPEFRAFLYYLNADINR